jgi:membrane peptidoglycan carboxypeptidase
MLKLAGLRDDDVVVDLGSGDGRVVLTAAKLNPKLRGWGVDIDEKLVAAANAAASAQGVSDRVRFSHQNAFDADLREATVIAMWFWPEMQRMMRDVVCDPSGTGELAQQGVENFAVAGKTGTGLKAQEHGYLNAAGERVYYASFVGFFPAESPKYVMVVILDEPAGKSWGSLDAAPVFRRIAEQLSPALIAERPRSGGREG